MPRLSATLNRPLTAFLVALLVSCAGQPSPQLPAPEVPAGPEIYFDDFEYDSVSSSEFRKDFIVTGDGSLVSFASAPTAAGPYAPSTSERVLRLRSITDGTDAGTRQGQVVTKGVHGQGTYAALVRFGDTPSCGRLGDRPVQAFYMASPTGATTPELFSELDFEYLPHGGWSTYTTPKLHLTSWDAYGNGLRKVTNTPLDGSYDGWHLLIATAINGEVRMSVNGQQLATYRPPYVPDSDMRIGWRSRILPNGRMTSSDLRCYDMDVDWVMFADKVALSPAEVQATVQSLRNR